MGNIHYKQLLVVVSSVLLLSACGQTVSTPVLPTPTAMMNTTISSSAMPLVSTRPTSSPSAVMGQMQKFEMTGIPFTFSYTPGWEVKQYGATEVSIMSPEGIARCAQTNPKFEGENMDCFSDITIAYYPTVAEEELNKINNLGAKTLAELLKNTKDLKEIGRTTIDGKTAVEVTQFGFVDVYSIYIESGKGLYTISFNLHSDKSQLTNDEKAILASLRLDTIPTANMNASVRTYAIPNTPFTFTYPPTWLLNQDAATSVSLSSPETLKMRQMYDRAPKAEGCATCEPNIVITYYPTIAEEPGNKLGQLGATSLSDLLKKDPNLKVRGQTSVDGVPATEVDLSDMVHVYALYIEKGKSLYTVIFNNRANKSELSAEEKAILASLKLTPSVSTTPVVGSSMMKTGN